MSSRVLQVVSSTARRGAETFALTLGAELEALGWEVRTVALARAGGGDDLDIEVLGRRRLSVPTLRALARHGASADVVVAHGSSTLPATAIARRGQPPLVYRNIGDPSHWSGRLDRRMWVGFALRRAHRVVAVSESASALLSSAYRVDPGRLCCIPTAASGTRFRPATPVERVDARRRFDVPLDVAVVAFVGALSPEKRVGDAIRAVAEVDDAHLLIAGDGPGRAEVAEEATRVLGPRGHVLGAVRDSETVLAASDVVVLPSATEGLPAVLIEAGLSGLPAVATDVGFVSDVVVDAVTGFLVPPGVPDRLVSALRRALEAAPALGAAGRAHCAAHFELESVAERWDALLRQLVRFPGGSRSH